MALVTCDFFSDALEMGASVTVVLPQRTESQIGVTSGDGPAGPPPVLYLLHGLSDDHTAWTRFTSIERYASAAGVAVVMPSVGRSFYADEIAGYPYWTYLSQELPRIVGTFFRVSDRPEDTFVAGLSMGGYGAMKLMLRHPERYAAAASLSGALDLVELSSLRSDLFTRIYGEPGFAHDDLYGMLAAADGAALPPLYLACGLDETDMLPAARRFEAQARAAGADVTTDYVPGTHEWGLWDATIARVIDWLPLASRTGGVPA